MKFRIFHLICSFLIILPLIEQVNAERESFEIDYDYLTQMIISPCCLQLNHPVSEHGSPIANQVKKDIKTRLNQGESRKEILNVYVEKYGLKVLAEPPQSGFHNIAYILPPVVSLMGVCLVIFLVWRWKSNKENPETLQFNENYQQIDEVDEKIQTRIEKEIQG